MNNRYFVPNKKICSNWQCLHVSIAEDCDCSTCGSTVIDEEQLQERSAIIEYDGITQRGYAERQACYLAMMAATGQSVDDSHVSLFCETWKTISET